MSTIERATVIRISRLGWCGLALVLLAPWIVILLMAGTRVPVGRTPNQVPASKIAATTHNRSAAEGKLRAGPWGDVEFSSMMIEPPEALVPVTDSTPKSPRWVFKGYSEASLQALWQQAGLTATQQQSLNDPTRRMADAEGITVSPASEDVVNLLPSAREKIYTALAAFPENIAQREPFRFRLDSVDEWFEGSDLSAETIAFTKSLVYQRNSTVFFSDQDVVLPRLKTSGERIRFLKAVSRKSALLLQLRITRDSNADALASYWGRGRRSKDLEPLLASLVRRPTGSSLDIVHLLPRFARSLLYTYPVPSDNVTDAARDCHWTSFNFYNEIPDERFSDIGFVKQALASKYYPVVGEPLLGDIILLLQRDGVVIHSCVFVADDIVFTKNGPSYSVPWVLTRLDYVVSFYGRGQDLELRRYRPNEL